MEEGVTRKQEFKVKKKTNKDPKWTNKRSQMSWIPNLDNVDTYIYISGDWIHI